MAAERICAECGAPLPENAPGNRCPKCLLSLGLEEPGNDDGPQKSAAPIAGKPGEPTDSNSLEERIGTLIGRYRLLQQIGEGGFGIVFMAEQTEPVQRKVALKVIKAGMDSREIIARFEAERQALAMMDHPNIARVLDGGTTPSRRPYFVMELVKGIPITEYCDQGQLSTRDRLELFIKVCRAVQHAHQKGVIHRDLKPGNVLVTLHDGEPVPKVIDFGVAKALDQKLTEKTLFTRFEQMIGTPAYMSPEQAALGGLDIDTRSDIYSLGVLLYELLTGVTPLDAEILRKGALDQIRRMIRETDPPTPSTRLRAMSDRLVDVARCRQTQPVTLSRLVRGDLDWVTMKCLEKDRQRRYETVNGLARDIERHLNNEPVVARPPSRLYEFQKTVRRHKFGFAAAGAVIVALFIGVLVSTWQAIRARRAEHEAQTEAAKSRQVSKFLEDTLGAAGPAVALGRDTTLLREILDRAAERVTSELKDEPLVAAELQVEIADVYVSLLDFDKGERLHRQALETRRKLLGPDHADIAYSLRHLANARRCQNQYGEVEALVREATAMYRRLGHPDLAYALVDLASSLVDQGKAEAAEMPNREAQELFRKASGDQRPNIATLVWQLGSIRRGQGRLGEAEQLMMEQLPTLRETAGQDGVYFSLGELASLQMDRSEWPQAEAILKEQLAIAKRIFSGTHFNYLASPYRGLAQVLMHQGKLEEAETFQQEGLSILRKDPGDQRQEIADTLRGLADIHRAQGKFDQAEVVLQEASSILSKDPADQRLKIARMNWQLADIRRAQGRNEEAEKVMIEQLPTLRELCSPSDLGFSLEGFAHFLMEDGKFAKAEELFRETLAIQRGIFNPNHRALMYTLLGLAECLSREGKRIEAETILRQGLAIQSKLSEDERHDPERWRWIGSILLMMDNFSEAEEWCRKALLDKSNWPRLTPKEYVKIVETLVIVLLGEAKFNEIEASYPEWLRNAHAGVPADDLGLADLLTQIMWAELVHGKFAEAEKLAGECVAIREKKLPDEWRTYEARCMLGSCLFHQKRYTEAEPLLVSGGYGLKQHATDIPDAWRPRVSADLKCVAQFYEATSCSNQAAEWKQTLQEFEQALTNKQTSAKPRP
jgi:serine/threonine protein kinase/tetratricopeptide (TPR) repeat protein